MRPVYKTMTGVYTLYTGTAFNCGPSSFYLDADGVSLAVPDLREMEIRSGDLVTALVVGTGRTGLPRPPLLLINRSRAQHWRNPAAGASAHTQMQFAFYIALFVAAMIVLAGTFYLWSSSPGFAAGAAIAGLFVAGISLHQIPVRWRKISREDLKALEENKLSWEILSDQAGSDLADQAAAEGEPAPGSSSLARPFTGTASAARH